MPHQTRPDTPFEGLESRIVLDGSLIFQAVYPEGFASDQINEFVPITNHGADPVQFELHAHYETGDVDQLIASGTIPPTTRGGVTISEVNHPNDTVVRKGEPYALVLMATGPLSATLSHYDFGTAIGESFTTDTSTTWTFAEGRKKGDQTRDFFLVYNPNETMVDIQIEFFQDGDRGVVTKNLHLEAKRRGGWAVNDIGELVEGNYSVRISSSAPVVAAESHYDFSQERGFGALGTPGGGATDGVVPSINYDDQFYDVNGDDSGRGIPRYAADSYLSILNTNDNAAIAVVTLTFVFDDPTIPTQDHVLVVNAASRATIRLRDYGLPEGEGYGVVYRATAPITVSGSRYQGMDATGEESSTVAATTWDFGEGYMSRERAGAGILEDIYLYNPQQGPADVNITLMRTDGKSIVISRSLDSGQLQDVKLHTIQALLDWADQEWYGIRVTATGPIVSMIEHWDSGNGGGFGTFGMPSGTVVRFGDALTLPGLPGNGNSNPGNPPSSGPGKGG